MGRQESVARSIVLSMPNGIRNQARRSISYIRAAFAAFFAIYQLQLEKIRPAEFANLRRNCWRVDDDSYLNSFQPSNGEQPETVLRSVGDLGFSGSTFYVTNDQRYLVKAVPRHSEYSFFRDDLLTPYAEHMSSHAHSLLVRICDFLASPSPSLGKIFGVVPSHHIIMENVLYGRDEAKKQGQLDWEHWDLKPTSYFFPERDIAGGRLTSEATKNQLADEFPDKIILSRGLADEFMSSLEQDTELLAQQNAVDYSLFLVRIKTRGEDPEDVTNPNASSSAEAAVVPEEPPFVPPSPPSWKTGVPSADGEHIFRAAILDFFWAKHKIQPKLMTFLINAWNAVVSRDGPMSITTTPKEYRERFLKMCRNFVEVVE